MKTDPEKGLVLLREVLPVLEAQEAFDNDSLFETLKVLRERKNIRSVMLCGRFVLQYQANRTHRAEQQTDGSSRKGRIS